MNPFRQLLLVALGFCATIAQPLPAARQFSGSNYLEAADPVRGVTPITIAAWFNAANATTLMPIAAVGRNGAGNASFRLSARGDTGGDPVQLITINASTSALANSTGGFTANTWHHACGVSSGPSHRVAYLDGVAGTPNATTITDPVDANLFNIATTKNTGTPLAHFTGSIAEVAVWSIDLNADEVAALAKGVPPILVRPQSLVFWAPLVREAIELRQGFTLTATGGASTVTTHPRIYR